MFACPNGVQGMSNAVEGLVETSCNLASVKMEGDNIVITVHQRSSVDSRRDEIADRVKALFTMIGCDVRFDDTYVGWDQIRIQRFLRWRKQVLSHCSGISPRWRRCTPALNVACSSKKCGA